MQTIIQAIQHYQPYNEQEENDRRVMLKLLETQPDILDRSNQVAHFSASAWVLNQNHTKILMIGPGPVDMQMVRPICYR